MFRTPVFAAALYLAIAPAASAATQAAVDAYNRGARAQAAHDFDAAITAYTEALQIDSGFAYAYANRGTVYLDEGDDDDAIPDLSQAVRLDGSDSLAFGNLGKAFLHKKQYDEAIADFSQAISLGTEDPKVYLGRAMARQAKGDDAGAASDLEVAKRKDPAVARAMASAAAKAGATWYLLLPLTITDKQGKSVAVTGAPLWSWVKMGTFNSSDRCEAERQALMNNPLFRGEAMAKTTGAAECVAGDDQRLQR
jgi:tetratricopeptide (TPR) repeat protein